MGNISHNGFRWAGNKVSPSAAIPTVIILPVANNYATTLSRGDPVKVISDGTCQLAAAGDTVYGVMDSVKQYYDGTVVRSGSKLPANTVWGTNNSRQSQIRVIPARGSLWRVTVNDNTTATTQAAYEAFVQENVEMVAGTASGDESGYQANISTHATTNTLSLRIENIPDKELTDFTSTGVSLLVSFNLIQDTASGSTTGT